MDKIYISAKRKNNALRLAGMWRCSSVSDLTLAYISKDDLVEWLRGEVKKAEGGGDDFDEGKVAAFRDVLDKINSI